METGSRSSVSDISLQAHATGQLKPTRGISLGVFLCKEKVPFLLRKFPTSLGEQTSTTSTTEECRKRKYTPLVVLDEHSGTEHGW